jgi:hypothetical protein
MLHGSCLCGNIRYEIDGSLGAAGHCHCTMCRKAHGAAFGTYSRVKRDAFRIVSGAEHIKTFASSQGITRTFCDTCGSTLQYISASKPGSFALALGTLDDDPGVRPVSHIFVGSKAPWYEITDDLPQHRGGG